MSIGALLAALLLSSHSLTASAAVLQQSNLDDRATTNATAQLPGVLSSWWHPTGEINTQTPVQNGNVRQSHLYSVQVAQASKPSQFYNSFVYESIPRNGNGDLCTPSTPGSPGTLCATPTDDQITIEPSVNITMAWTQFLYGADTIVQVSRLNGQPIAASDVVIRPSNLAYTINSVNGAALITVPYNSNGVRFSVEFQDDLWTYRNQQGGENSHYVQDVNPNGVAYVSSYTSDMPIVGVEPRNALLIFASPFPTSDLVPNDPENTLNVRAGRITGLNTTTKSIVYFGPGVYWSTGADHALLSSSVNWVYFAPGAYVKSAIEYSSGASQLKATGFGVLSGEQYVYQANTQLGYANTKSDDNSLHIWKAVTGTTGVTWTLHGVTMNAPPFNSMDFYGNVDSFTVNAWDYKQVGAFFGQTDGIEMYPGSNVHDIFYHAGDDVLKTYYSNVLVERVVVWKTNNAPIIQFGWYPRTLTNITVDSVDVVHCRYISQAAPYPRALVGSAASYLNTAATNDASINAYISDYTVSNWRSEGLSPALLGINPLSNIDTFLIENVWIEELAPDTTQVDMSTFTVFTDSSNNNAPVKLGQNSPNNLGLTIKNYTVGNTRVTLAAGNWDSYSLGRLDIDGSYWQRWTAI